MPRAPRVEDATANALMLLQDVLILSPGGSWNCRPLLQGQPLRKHWARTEWRIDYWQRGVVTWPTPIWSTFWEYDHFLSHWNAALDDYKHEMAHLDAEKQLDYLIFCWIDSATAVLRGLHPIGVKRQGAFIEVAWGALVDRLAFLADEEADGGLTDDHRDGWLLDVSFMLLPEVTGLSWKRPPVFRESVWLKGFWRRGSWRWRTTVGGSWRCASWSPACSNSRTSWERRSLPASPRTSGSE